MEGVRIIKSHNHKVIYIDFLSNGLKQVIREQLQGIWNGFSFVDELPEYFSYKNTLSSFLERYNNFSENTQKGMIGELLTHILLLDQDKSLTSLSILKNKEEKSIKKGFDIIYYETGKNKLWYSEVKSGNSNGRHPTSSNKTLLDRAKNGIHAMILGNRNSLWESALFDVSATIRDREEKLNMRKLLSNDAPIVNLNQKKNVILISVLYHNIAEGEIDNNSVIKYYEDTVKEDLFLDTIIISIQKSTFEAVASFLQNEI